MKPKMTFQVKKTKKPVIIQGTEHEEQVAFFEWLRIASSVHEGLKWAFAIPNGGARHIVAAMKLKAEGVKPGVPDIFIPVPKGKYHGLFIEMKRKSNSKLSEEQAAYLGNLTILGYFCHVAHGWDEAKIITEKYINDAR